MKDLDKTALSSEMTQTHAQTSQTIHHHPQTLQDTTSPTLRSKTKPVEKYTIHLREPTTPSYMIGSIWKLVIQAP